MHDLPAIERNAREISQKAARTLGILGAAESMPSPVLYDQVISDLSGLRDVWTEHVRLLSEVLFLIFPHSDRATIVPLQEFEQQIAEIALCLETLSSAGWARSPEIGVNAIRVRVAQTLAVILRQMERERTTILPLLRHSIDRSVGTNPVVRQMMTA